MVRRELLTDKRADGLVLKDITGKDGLRGATFQPQAAAAKSVCGTRTEEIRTNNSTLSFPQTGSFRLFAGILFIVSVRCAQNGST
jgi:hypothetical protein